MLEHWLLFLPGLFVGTLLSAALGGLGTVLRVRDEALAAFSYAQVAVLGAMLAGILALPVVAGAWALAVLAGLLVQSPIAKLAGSSSRHLVLLLVAWAAALLLADNHPQARLLSMSAVEGQLLLLQWRDVPAFTVLSLTSVLALVLTYRRWFAAQLLPWRVTVQGTKPSRWPHMLRELAVIGLLASGALALGVFVMLALVVIPAWVAWGRARRFSQAVAFSAAAGAAAHLLAFILALHFDQVYSAVMVMSTAVLAVLLGLVWTKIRHIQ